MGLCKCPRKKVTNQFCFEHRVNVCEHCMVSNHSKCVVQSYLQWLQDSDYDPNCHLCKTELAEGDCVRLTCYHVFHWDCLNKFASCISPQKLPEGYKCPICDECIFPKPNAASPVAEALKTTLLGVNWARAGLGFPAVENNLPTEKPQPSNIQLSAMQSSNPPAYDKVNKVAPVNISNSNLNQSHKVDVNNTRPEPYGASYTAPYSTPRKLYDATEHGPFRPSLVDHDENKYKRRTALEWFGRWFHSRTNQGGSHKRDPNVLYKKWVVLLVLSLIAVLTLCILFLKLGRANSEGDPLLDPHFNPNIRVEENNAEELHPVSPNHEPAFMNQNSVQGNMKEVLPA